MARKSSKRSDQVVETDQDQAGPDTAEGTAAPVSDPTPETDTEAVIDAEIVDETAATADATTDAVAAPEESAPTDTPPETEPTPVVAPPVDPAPARRGPGFVPLVLGGVVAGAIGYGLAFTGVLPVPNAQTDDALAALTTTLDAQAETLQALAAQTQGIEDAVAALPEMPDVPTLDLSPIDARLSDLDGTISSLADRIAALEARPVLSGEGGDADTAAMAAAVAQLQSQLQEQQAANAAMTDEIRTLASEAETRIAEAEARAEARAGTAAAQAAISELRIAVAAGNPFADALAEVAGSAGLDVPESLRAAAETGVPTLEDLQATFPAAARAALPVGLRETAGDGTMDRVGAFLRGQVGGRSLEPMDGDGPDAILSRAEAALAAGALPDALREIGTLPEGARAEMDAWVAEAGARQTATAALEAFSAALDGTN